MSERDVPGDFTAALSAYLATLMTMGDCVAIANPEVGGPYKQRLNRLRARVAFQPTAVTITEATATVDTELKEYAALATRQAARQSAELRREVSSFREIIEGLARRQDFYANRLRQFAAQIEGTRYPTDPDHLAEVVTLQASGLRSCVESMGNETASLVARMRHEIANVDQRLASVKCVDPLTGLINHDEMVHQIETHAEASQANKTAFSLLLFDVMFDVPPAKPSAASDVMRQAADRLLTQFRLSDRVGRWDERQFMVLFLGPHDLAEARAKQVLPWLAGSYSLDSGETVEVALTTRLVSEPTLSAALR